MIRKTRAAFADAAASFSVSAAFRARVRSTNPRRGTVRNDPGRLTSSDAQRLHKSLPRMRDRHGDIDLQREAVHYLAHVAPAVRRGAARWDARQAT